MDFPLRELGPALTARAGTWERLGLAWTIGPVLPNRAPAVVQAEFESAELVGDLMIWVSGEAELSTVRLTDDRMVNKHYDLATVDDLEVVLDELVVLLTDGIAPAAAVVDRFPSGDPRIPAPQIRPE
ncbi:hypothetical protein AB0C12_02950 [Actinoplanes sp. NPDC048967]|uniref:hypothetical protein n=1 Tax=Actinoplanes sp. NPDC048967 TaxID=3155269 RepID=UPI0033D48E7B